MDFAGSFVFNDLTAVLFRAFPHSGLPTRKAGFQHGTGAEQLSIGSRIDHPRIIAGVSEIGNTFARNSDLTEQRRLDHQACQ
jgi:hypothetical protein